MRACVCVCVCAALTLIIPHHARQHATQLLNAALRPNEERKNVRGICLSHTNTNEYIRIHPTFIECVMGFSSPIPFSCSRLLASLVSRFSILVRFSFYDFCPAAILCHNFAACFTIYIYIRIASYISHVYIVYIGLVLWKKVSLGKRQKVLRFRTITSNKTAGCKRGVCPPICCLSYSFHSLSHSLTLYVSFALSPSLNIPSSVASLGCGLMSLPRRRQTHPHTAALPHCHTATYSRGEFIGACNTFIGN